MPLLNHVKQILLAEAHRDVLYHDSCESLDAIQDGMEVNRIICQFSCMVNDLLLLVVGLMRLKGRWLHLMLVTAHAEDMGWRALR